MKIFNFNNEEKSDQMNFCFKDLSKEDQELLEKLRKNTEELFDIRKEIARNFINKLETVKPVFETKRERKDDDALLELLTPEFKHTYGSLIYMLFLLRETEESIVEICDGLIDQISKNIRFLEDGIEIVGHHKEGEC